MANAVYPTYKGFILSGAADTSLTVNTSQDGPYANLVDTGTYTYSAAHDFKNDLVGEVVGSEGADGVRIQNPTVSASTGVFDGDNVTFTAVTGATVEAYTIYRHNAGADTTWKMVLYYDTAGGGLPVTPNGGDITISWNASGIFLISDARVKENIRHVGNLDGLSICEFNYVWSDEKHIGLIAQEVERKFPDAVAINPNGLKGVNYHAVQERTCK